MNQKHINIVLAAAGVIAVVLCAYALYRTQWYCLMFREQQQLFLYERGYVMGLLCQAGGAAMVMAQWLTQFFINPNWGVAITTLLLALITLFSWLTISKVCEGWHAFPLSFAPAILAAMSLMVDNYYYSGLTAQLLAFAAVWLYTLASDEKPVRRLIIATLIAVVLYLIAGSAYTLFVLCAIVYDFCRHRRRPLLSLTLIVVWLIIGFVAVKTALAPSYEYAFTPLPYYLMTEEDIVFKYLLSWVALPISLLLAWLLRRFNLQKAFSKAIACIVMICISVVPCSIIYAKEYSPQIALTQKFDLMARYDNWDGILRLLQDGIHNPTEGNYLNMALAEKGELCNKLFDYDQYGPEYILFDNSGRSLNVLRTCAYVLYSMGNVAGAQDKAFNAMLVPLGYDPVMLKMVATCDIIRGEYKTAQKYLDLLKDSRNYHHWAEDMEKYLYRDDLVMKNSTFNRLRKDMQGRDYFVLLTNAFDDLDHIVDANPHDSKAMEYMIAGLVLSKDLERTYQFIDKHYGSPALRKLPRVAQEALLFYSNYIHSIAPEDASNVGLTQEQYRERLSLDADYCRKHGVEQETFSRFDEFGRLYQSYMQGRPTDFGDLQHTFWYYTMFVQLNNQQQ